MLSPYSRDLKERLAKSTGPTTKLTPNLKDKYNYIVHERNLRLYLQQGLLLTKVHRVMEFRQEAWIKPYIDLNTRNRAAARAKFEQDFFKLMNNAVFGKSMENVRKYQEIQLVTTQKRLDKLVANLANNIILLLRKASLLYQWRKKKLFSISRYIPAFRFWIFPRSSCTDFTMNI